MMNKILILSPAGGNGNYIALVLMNLLGKSELCYHMQGTHGPCKGGLIYHVHTWTSEKEYLLGDKDCITLQNVFDENFWFVIINWWEKMYYNVDPNDRLAKGFIEDWLITQTKIWSKYRHPIVRAVLHWFYGYFTKTHPECKRIEKIKSTFNFSAFYEDYQALALEFEKFGIDYTEEMYQKWKSSQSVIFQSYNNILNSDIKGLKFDYQKAIKIGFLGIENNLNERQCWESFKKYLD